MADGNVTYSWIPKKICYSLEKSRRHLPRQNVLSSDFHPLKSIIVVESNAAKVRKRETRSRQVDSRSDTKSTNSNSSNEFIDPLSALGVDPLSANIPNPSLSNTAKELPDKTRESSNDYLDWEPRKIKILSEYTTTEKLAMSMTSIATKTGNGSSARQSATVSDKLKDRLVQLDIETSNKDELKNLSQQEFIEKIQELQHNLTTAWQTNQKVNALKLAIQSAKMLGETSVMEFYPSKYVLVVEILNTFGKLVFNRILSMCGSGMAEDLIDPAKVPENAREICMNWMLKVASIRELLPRLYVEAAILACYKFLDNGDINSQLVRLTNMARGVGNPLIAVYVRAYLCLVGARHSPNFKGHFKTSFYDFVTTYKQIHTSSIQNYLIHRKVDMQSYMKLFTPALEWIISCLSCNAHEDLLVEVLAKCEKTGWSLLILNCAISSFSSAYVTPRAKELCQIVIHSEDKFFDKNILMRTLGAKLINGKVPDKHKLSILNEAWKYFMKLQSSDEYIKCVEIWSEFAAINFRTKEMRTIIGDIILHMTPDRAFEKYYPQLLNIMENMLRHMNNYEDIFAMDKFLPFIDLFQSDEVKKSVCKIVAGNFIRANTETSDPVVINGLMYVCKSLHNTINTMTNDDERKSITVLVNGIISKITFGRDFEQQLNFYVECRGSFYKLDGVFIHLVHLVNTLSTRITRIVHGKHTKKTGAFQRACAAYCFITIPSVSNVHDRLSLYLISGQVALLNQCVAQGDAMFRASISQLLEMSQSITQSDGKSVSSESFLVQYISNYLSALLAVPDHPDQGVLYLLRGMLNVISGKIGDEGIILKSVQCRVYVKVLCLLTAFAQDQYLYKFKGVDSNEALYSSSNEFLHEISNIGTMILDVILAYLMSSTNNKQKIMNQNSICWELLQTVVSHADVNNTSTQKLIANLWELAIRDRNATTKYKMEMLDSMKRKGGIHAKLASSLPLTTTA